MTKPSLTTVQWATDATALKTATDTNRWLYGWMTTPANSPTGIGEKPNLNHQNYWQNSVYNYLNYLTFTPQVPLTGLAYVSELESTTSKIVDENLGTEWNAAMMLLDNNKAVSSTAYEGGVYSPIQNRIYLIPYGEGNQADWQYIDCDTGKFVDYTHGATVVTLGYSGGAYHPVLKRLYMAPMDQAVEANWHYIATYIDHSTAGPTVQPYTAGVGGVAKAYSGAVYSPTQERIYFVPYGQSGETNWHYISSTGVVTAYGHGATVLANAYRGGCYSPSQDRIYLIPYGQGGSADWHYIDCSDGSVVAYTHGATVAGNGYAGGVYSPLQDRIYLIPMNQSNSPNWHYIDCSDGSVVAYAHGATIATANAYFGGCYSPVTNNIYMGPNNESEENDWHYIDCDDGSVLSYGADLGTWAAAASTRGMVYSPTNNRVYAVPYGQGNLSRKIIIQEYGKPVSRQYMSNGIFNKGI